MNDSITRPKYLAPDRYLEACPIRYECRYLFMYLIEMEYCTQTDNIEILLNYPEKNDFKYFNDDQKLENFKNDIKKFAFPYSKIATRSNSNPQAVSPALVQFYTFVLTDANRIRQYGFCRSAQNGKHILCIVSYLPWYNVFMNILNKISDIINDKDTNALYNFLEALYQYELPEPGNSATIFSHDGEDQMKIECPDRRVLPTILDNRNLQKLFSFFDLDKLKKIFTALILERSLLVVSKDLENLTSCGLSLEYLIYPLEWLHTFVPIVPEHIDTHVFNQPFPFIYGVHTAIYEQLNQSQLDNCIVLLLDERVVLNGGKDRLPTRVDEYLTRKLDYFKREKSDSNLSSASKTYDLLHTGTLRPFLESVLMIIDDYREYILYDEVKSEFKFDETRFFKIKNVNNESTSKKYHSNENEFYHEFRITQAFEEFCRDRADYLNRERLFNSKSTSTKFQKDFIDCLFEQNLTERSKLTSKIDEKFRDIRNKAQNLIRNKQQQIKHSTSFDNELSSRAIKTTTTTITPSINTESKVEFCDTSSSSSSSLSTDDVIKSNISKRLTIDLSNDPDIKKYFDDNFVDKIEENLIDISDSLSPPPLLPPPKPQRMENKIENLFDDLLLIKEDPQVNQILNPINEDQNSLKSILNEFDPFSESSKQQETIVQPKPAFQFTNLTPKPFQPHNFVKPSNVSVTQNTNNQIQATSNLYRAPPPQLNPFAPTPFYSNLSQSYHGYRPVNFQINNTNKLAPNLPLTKNQFNLNRVVSMNSTTTNTPPQQQQQQQDCSFDDDFNPI